MRPPVPADQPRDRPPVQFRRRVRRSPLTSLRWGRLSALLGISGLMLITMIHWIGSWNGERSPWDNRAWTGEPMPLVMNGGDPYIRALMRTISASESSDPSPYTLLYGGEHSETLREHPDECVPIVAGPNVGKCTTAAGRYQFLTTTWLEKAAVYHPRPKGFSIWRSYSFAPRYQDEVVYAWLNDPSAWGEDIGEMLRAGEIEDVLWLLSGTWTSLGYGIESNVMSSSLPDIYAEMLDQELRQAKNSPSANGRSPVTKRAEPF